MAKHSLLLVLAHPDDETFGPGGTVARYSREGVRVTLITATSGQAGRAGGLASTPAKLGRIREQETIEAAGVLGIAQVHFLGCMDGKLAEADEQEIEEGIVRLIRQERPEVVVTFGPEGAGNEHRDHQQISRIATAAVASAGDPERFPGQLESGLHTHLVSKFYYMTGRTNPWRQMSRPFLPVTTAIDVSEWLEAKRAAFRRHRSQQEWTGRLEEWIAANGEQEVYHLASTILHHELPKAEVETDLFAGL